MKTRLAILRDRVEDVLKEVEDQGERKKAFVHLHGVAAAAAMIAERRRESGELAAMAGMLHDLYSYKANTEEDHAHRGAVLAREILEDLELTNEGETRLIVTAIHNHSDKTVVHAPFDEVLKDADVFQHCIYDPTEPVKEKHRARFVKLLREFDLRDMERLTEGGEEDP